MTDHDDAAIDQDEAAVNDDDSDEAMVQALDLHRCLAECQGLGTADAAHCLIGCGLFVLAEDLPLDEALEQIAIVRKALDEREAELRGGVN